MINPAKAARERAAILTILFLIPLFSEIKYQLTKFGQ